MSRPATDGRELNEAALLEQLRAVVDHYPLEPGDTLSHALARGCAERRWIVRDGGGRWIPTAAGVTRDLHAGGRP